MDKATEIARQINYMCFSGFEKSDFDQECCANLIRHHLDELIDVAKTYQELCVCYRIGKRPTEVLFKRIEKARLIVDPLPEAPQ